MTMPKRIQRRRAKGWRMPPDTVYVGRPTKWGNPVKVTPEIGAKEATRMFRRLLKMPQSRLVEIAENPLFGLHLCVWREQIKRNIGKLRGKNLACWCALDQPCHADILLEMANA